MINSITGMSVKWLIGRKRPGAGRPVTICRSPEPVHLPAIPMRCVVWLVGTNNTDVYGLHIRGVPSGSWLLYQGRIFRKKRIYRKRVDGESERELGTESEQWRDLMQEDSDAFLEACFDDPELMKELFPGLWRQRIGDDGDIKELLGAEYYNERPDEKNEMFRTDPDRFKSLWPAEYIERKRQDGQQVEDDRQDPTPEQEDGEEPLGF